MLHRPEPSGGLLAAHSGIRRAEGRAGQGRNKRSVWEIATQPYAAAHFATFPTKLVEPCVLAGSSERACGECGAPWWRVVQCEAMEVRPGPTREARQAASTGAEQRRAVNGTMTKAPTSRTVGWRPGCRCYDAPYAKRPRALSARKRRQQDQAARRRIADDQPLLNHVAEVAAV